MEGLSGIDSALYMAADSLAVHSVGMQVTAHNIANVSTADFLPQRATYATGQNGVGVELQSVRKQDAPLGRPSLANNAEASESAAKIRASGTELAREIPQMIATQRAFEANAATIRTAEEMSATILNIIA